MAKRNLTNLIENLDTLSNNELIEIGKYFMEKGRDCGLCDDCDLKYHIIDVYKLHKHQHLHNRRHNPKDEMAEQYVSLRYGEPNDK